MLTPWHIIKMFGSSNLEGKIMILMEHAEEGYLFDFLKGRLLYESWCLEYFCSNFT
jgi:hypothetical protein